MPNMSCCASISFRVAGGAVSMVSSGSRGIRRTPPHMCARVAQCGDNNSCPRDDRILMLLSQQANQTLWPIDNDRKEICDVTAKHTHVESFRCCDRGILAAKYDFTIVFTRQPHAGFDNGCMHHTPDSTKWALSNDGLNAECLQNVCA